MKTHHDTEAIKAAHPLPEFFEAHGVQLTRTGATRFCRGDVHSIASSMGRR
ncbi:MAG: hypothetical protein H7A55_08065 [Verrucomicrobiaceae bacterium]|nr:hypothetical protein [Verrucomicrobiaceae bacterium]